MKFESIKKLKSADKYKRDQPDDEYDSYHSDSEMPAPTNTYKVIEVEHECTEACTTALPGDIKACFASGDEDDPLNNFIKEFRTFEIDSEERLAVSEARVAFYAATFNLCDDAWVGNIDIHLNQMSVILIKGS